VLDAEPLCRYCRNQGLITPATVVDHILALALGGGNDPANLAPACQPCNAAKAKAEARFLQRGYDSRMVHFDLDLAPWFKRAAPLLLRNT